MVGVVDIYPVMMDSRLGSGSVHPLDPALDE